MNQQQALDKVKKLLSLSKSVNINEAAQAAAQAQRIMVKYEIEAAMLAEDEEEDPLDKEEIERQDLDEEKGSRKAWKGRLAMAIAEQNQCMIFTSQICRNRRSYRAVKYRIAGKPTQIAKCKYLFQYLNREIERLINKEPKGLGRVWYNNFRHGAVDTIKSKLAEANKIAKEEIKEEHKETMALVKIDHALAKIEKRQQELNDWEKKQGFINTPGCHFRSNYDARQSGREAAKSIKIGNASGAIGSGSKLIKG